MGLVDGGVFDLDDTESFAFRFLPEIFSRRREGGQRKRIKIQIRIKRKMISGGKEL